MFGISDFGAFCLTTLIFLALPGPGTFTLLTSTAQGGLRAGSAALLGVMLGDQVLMWLAFGGVAALMSAYPAVFHAVQYSGAAYVAWVGLRLVFAGDAPLSPVRIRPHHYLRQGMLITLLNPKAIMFYMAFFPLFVNPALHRGAVTFVAMALTAAALTATYGFSLCLCAALVSSKVRAHYHLVRWMRKLAGWVLIGFGIRLASHT